MISCLKQILLILILVVPDRATKTFQLNPVNTKISFSAKHLGVLNVSGKFTDFKGSIVMDGTLVKSAFISINANTINTGNKNRDKSLKTDVFLDPKEYPKISFESKENLRSGEIEGFLKIKRSSNSAVVTYITERKGDSLIISGNYILKRNQYDLDFGAMDDLVSNEVKVQICIKLIL